MFSCLVTLHMWYWNVLSKRLSKKVISKVFTYKLIIDQVNVCRQCIHDFLIVSFDFLFMQWDCGKFILKHLDCSPSFSTSDSQLGCASLKTRARILIVKHNIPSHSRILIGSCLWSIRGQTHDWRHHYKVFLSVVWKWRKDLRI